MVLIGCKLDLSMENCLHWYLLSFSDTLFISLHTFILCLLLSVHFLQIISEDRKCAPYGGICLDLVSKQISNNGGNHHGDDSNFQVTCWVTTVTIATVGSAWSETEWQFDLWFGTAHGAASCVDFNSKWVRNGFLAWFIRVADTISGWHAGGYTVSTISVGHAVTLVALECACGGN